jgi:hypothetical protein
VCSIEKISEQYLIPALETMLDLFPLKLSAFILAMAVSTENLLTLTLLRLSKSELLTDSAN